MKRNQLGGRRIQALGTMAITPLPPPVKYVCISRGGVPRAKHTWWGSKKCVFCDMSEVESKSTIAQELYHRRLRDAIAQVRGMRYGPRFDGPDGSS